MTATLTEAFEEVCAMEGSLSERLKAYVNRLGLLNPAFAEAYDELVKRLFDGRIDARAPRVGDVMPPFVLPGPKLRLYDMDELLEQGPLVISFNRGHWCPLCKIELLSIAQRHQQITGLGARIVSIMPDLQKFSGRLDEEVRNHILILSDIDNAYSLSTGLALWLGDRLHDLMAGRGQQLEHYQGNSGWFVPLPSTFVVAQDGRIAGRHVDPDFRTRMEPSEIVQILQKLAQPNAGLCYPAGGLGDPS